VAAIAFFDQDRPNVGFEELGTFGCNTAIGKGFVKNAEAGQQAEAYRTHQFLAVEVHQAPLRCGSETTVNVGSVGRQERMSRPAGGPSRGDRLVVFYERLRRVGGRLGFRGSHCTRRGIGVHLEKLAEKSLEVWLDIAC
jgi:hypothetical protein